MVDGLWLSYQYNQTLLFNSDNDIKRSKREVSEIRENYKRGTSTDFRRRGAFPVPQHFVWLT